MSNVGNQISTRPDRTVAVLNDGNSVIAVDDNCYVVYNWNGNEWGRSAWIFSEAVSTLKGLPDNPADATTIV